jgi:hypothetical protein
MKMNDSIDIQITRAANGFIVDIDNICYVYDLDNVEELLKVIAKSMGFTAHVTHAFAKDEND